MHGSPLSKYDNRDLWKRYDFKQFGIVGEAYLSINHPEIYYLTDTGRNWSNKYNIRDRFIWKSINCVKNTDDLITWLSQMNSSVNRLYMTVHPERWASNEFEWCLYYLRDLSFNIGKVLLSHIVKR